MKLLVLGGAGYIGSVLCRAAIRRGHQVVVIDDLSYHQGHIAYQLTLDGIKFIRHDVRDIAGYHQDLVGADAVIHLAAVVGAPACAARPELAVSVNAGSVHTVVAALSLAQVLLVPNTNSGYGTTGAEACTEETPLQPISLYGQTKKIAEHCALERQRSIVLRLATVFGWSPRMRLDLLVNQFAYLAYFNKRIDLFGGSMRRNFVHISDVVDVMLAAVTMPACYGQVYNVGNDLINMTKRQLADTACVMLGGSVVEASGDDPDCRDYVVSSQKMQQVGLRCDIDLVTGLAELQDWMHMLPSDPEARASVTRYLSTVCV